MESAFHSLEITVLSAENLKLDGKSVKNNTFVVIKFDNSSNNSRSTRADHEGRSNPCWNQKLEINMPVHSPFIILEVQTRMGSVNRLIGTVHVPVSDFLSGHLPENYLQFLSYRLRDGRGQKNGIINFCLKVKELGHYAVPTVRKNSPVDTWNSPISSSAAWGLPIGQKKWHGLGGGEVVTGVPAVWPCASRLNYKEFEFFHGFFLSNEKY